MFRVPERLRTALFVVALGTAWLAWPAAAAASTGLVAGGSVQQVYVTGARPGESLVLVNRRGATVAQLPAGSLGGRCSAAWRPGPDIASGPPGVVPRHER
jgi:hypothetical protein